MTTIGGGMDLNALAAETLHFEPVLTKLGLTRILMRGGASEEAASAAADTALAAQQEAREAAEPKKKR